jgi:transglutaminase-like putative cysteine protease
MIYHISHITNYYYSNNVSLCHNLAHLAARNCPWQTCLDHGLHFSTPPAVSSTRTDYFGNLVTFFTVQEPHKKLEITALNAVQVHPRPAPDPGRTMPWEEATGVLRSCRDAVTFDAYQYAFDSHFVRRDPALAAYAAPSFLPGRPLLEAVLDLTRRIFTDFIFDSNTNHFETPLPELLEIRRGVCQDFSHLEIGCLRSLGLAARYVSGYLLTNPPPGQDRLVGADMSHAWVSVFCPGAGWIDVDPTNNVITQEKHITLAWGRDYDDVSPIKGVILGGGRHSVTVGVDVVMVKEATPGDAAPGDAVPKDATPEDAVPKDATPEDVPAGEAAPGDGASKDVALGGAVSKEAG